MWFSTWLNNRTTDRAARRRMLRRAAPSRFRPRLEALEDRTLLSNYTAGSVTDLIADINAANKAGGANTITLAANTTFDLTAANNTTNGHNGLPVISGGSRKVAAGNLTIFGSGDTLNASQVGRLFEVARGATLTLQDITLTGGLASGSGAAADGGAIYNQGTLELQGVTVSGNVAQGSNGAAGVIIKTKHGQKTTPALAGADAAGGGLYIAGGTVTLEDLTQNGVTIHTRLQGNTAQGGQGGIGHLSVDPSFGGNGGNGYGGGLYEAGGSVKATNALLSGNTAQGGAGGNCGGNGLSSGGLGGGGFGGGMAMAGGTATLSGVTVESNSALGGKGGDGFSSGIEAANGGGGGGGLGGGLYASIGTLKLTGGAVDSNTAQGGAGGNSVAPLYGGGSRDGGSGAYGAGGGLALAGAAATLSGVTVDSNHAKGGRGGEGYTTNRPSQIESGGNGGDGDGGGLYVSGGTVSLTGDSVSSNAATGAAGVSALSLVGRAGNGFGGGLFVANGTVDLTSVTATGNKATGGTGYESNAGFGEGGGLYIDPYTNPSVCLDAFTIANIKNNTPDNIYGTYSTC